MRYSEIFNVQADALEAKGVFIANPEWRASQNARPKRASQLFGRLRLHS